MDKLETFADMSSYTELEFTQNEALNPSEIDGDERLRFKIKFKTAELFYGLSATIALENESGQTVATYKTAKRKLGGLALIGPVEIKCEIYHLRYPEGRYRFKVEIKNFERPLQSASSDLFDIKRSTDILSDKNLGAKILDIWPEHPHRLPPPRIVDWDRKNKPIWAQERYCERVEPRDESDPLWVHVHIPKCGGTTFRRTILPEWFPDKTRWVTPPNVFAVDYLQRDELASADPEFSKRIDLVSGHDCYDTLPQHNRKVIHTCFFRDPIERTSSQWNHHVGAVNADEAGQTTATRFGAYLLNRFKDEETYVKRVDIMKDYWRAFLTVKELKVFYVRNMQIYVDGSINRHIKSADPRFGEWLENTANERIAALPFVLLTERFDESIVFLHLAYGLPLIPYKRQRTYRTQEQVEAFQQKRLKLIEARPDAHEFHENILKRFEEQIASFPNFQAVFETYQKMNDALLQ